MELGISKFGVRYSPGITLVLGKLRFTIAANTNAVLLGTRSGNIQIDGKKASCPKGRVLLHYLTTGRAAWIHTFIV
jgi:hypothetical protein